MRPVRSTRSRKVSFPCSRRPSTRPATRRESSASVPGSSRSAAALTSAIASRSGNRFAGMAAECTRKWLLGEQPEGGMVSGLDGTEVPAVKGDHDISRQPLGKRDDGRVGSTKRKVAVPLDQLADARPVFRRGGFDVEPLEPAEELGLDLGTKSSAD